MNPTPAKIAMGLNNENFEEGEPIFLKAVVVGNPSPQVKKNFSYQTIIQY
jgi:hypothetical protein